MKSYILAIVVFFTCAHSVYGAFEITEIMYDADGTDTDREWVEVRNTSQSPDDLSKWYLFSGNTKHALVPQGVSSIPSNGYAIICQNALKFKADFPSYSGLLFDASWTGFNNETGTIALKDPELNIVSSVSYSSDMGGAGNGDSFQKQGSVWKGGQPTPGQGFDQSSATTSSTSSTQGGSTTTTSQTSITPSKTPVKKEIEVPKISTDIQVKNIAFAGLPFSVDSMTLGYSKEQLIRGRYVWNFGDGMSREEKEKSQFEYIYEYPGEYLLTLSYYTDFYKKIPDATDRVSIKVVSPGVVISSIGDASDPYVELENTSSYEMPLSQWIVKSTSHSFVMPDGTIILSGKKLKFSPRVTHFTETDVKNISLVAPTGENIFSYPIVKEKEVSKVLNTSSSRTSSARSYIPKASAQETTTVNLNTLEANAHNSNVKTFSPVWIAVVGIIILGMASVILLGRKKSKKEELSEEVRPEDMALME